MKKVLGSSIERGEVNGTFYAQLVARIGEDHWWFAMAIPKLGAQQYYLIQVYGDKRLLTLAAADVTEFYVLEG